MPIIQPANPTKCDSGERSIDGRDGLVGCVHKPRTRATKKAGGRGWVGKSCGRAVIRSDFIRMRIEDIACYFTRQLGAADYGLPPLPPTHRGMV